MKTEEEARKCWCPFVRLRSHVGVANRVGSALLEMAAKQRAEGRDLRDAEFIEREARDSNCIASECMAWRLEFGDAIKSTGDWVANLDEYRQALSKNDVERKATGRGYCGLAGKP